MLFKIYNAVSEVEDENEDTDINSKRINIFTPINPPEAILLTDY